jgi:hypothetical protein
MALLGVAGTEKGVTFGVDTHSEVHVAAAFTSDP